MLTDGPSFQGADEYPDLAAHDATDLPCLRKDFLYDPWQVAESRALWRRLHPDHHGRAVDDAQAAELEDAAIALGMDVLIEVHDRAELDAREPAEIPADRHQQPQPAHASRSRWTPPAIWPAGCPKTG